MAPKEGTVAWYMAELLARQAAFENMLKAPNLSEEDRRAWKARLDEAAYMLEELRTDPVGGIQLIHIEQALAVGKGCWLQA